MIYKPNSTVVVHCYPSEITNDPFSCTEDMGWIEVRANWAEEQCQKQGWESLDHFTLEYTLDDTINWLSLSLEGKGFVACGMGVKSN